MSVTEAFLVSGAVAMLGAFGTMAAGVAIRKFAPEDAGVIAGQFFIAGVWAFASAGVAKMF